MEVSKTACLYKVQCYRLAPLLFGGNHILVIFAQNMHQNLFFRAPNAKFPLPWEGGHSLPDHPTARSLRPLADYSRRHEYIGHFQRRSLANCDGCIWNGMLKVRCYRLSPWLFGGKHILVISAQNIHQNLCVFAAFFRFAPSQFSSEVHSLGFFSTPPPEKFLVTGLNACQCHPYCDQALVDLYPQTLMIFSKVQWHCQNCVKESYDIR